MDNQLMHARQLCLNQAQGFIEAAGRLHADWPHIVYHLSLLALEEVGKASMLGARMINHANLDGSWIERSLNSHSRKLQWAVWSPIVRIDPADFEAARKFAERAHTMRLASLYVDPKAALTDLPPPEQVRWEDAKQTLSLARSRLDYERERGTASGEIDDLTEWFLNTMADADQSRLLLSKPFIEQFEKMNGDPRAWAGWGREEIARLDQEYRQILLEAELARPGAPDGSAKPRWRANALVYTPSHSLRTKVLTHWNDQIESVQLLWMGKKDELTLQITLHDNEPLPSVGGRLITLAKLVVACLNIGSIGYFWFERPGFEQKMFKEVRDLELNRLIEVERRGSFWGTGRAVALTEEHIDHAIHCMMAFAPLPEAEAQPIFEPYFHDLAFIAKSDFFYDFDLLARRAFVTSLEGALRRYGGWSGNADDFEASFHAGFAPFMPEREHRDSPASEKEGTAQFVKPEDFGMRAMQIIEWGKPLEAREYADPEPTGEEVLLRVEAAGVCHSDVHIWDGHFDLGGGRQISLESRGVHLPFTMGHEIAGEVAALGPQAFGVEISDKVVAYPWIGCGECAVCRKGEELLCLNPRTLGTRRAGGYGTHVIVPHGRYLLPHPGVPQGLAATYTCSGITAFSALKKTRDHVGADDHLVIIGAGGVGGSAVHIAPAAVAGKIVVADIDAQKRAHARQMGAVATIDNSAPDAVKQVMEATGGGAAAAIDFVGSPKTMEFGVNILKKGGKLVMVGLYGGAHPISTVLFPFKMMTIEGSYVGTLDDLRELLALVQSGKVPPIPIETRPADQASAALSDLKSGGKVRGRVVLHHRHGGQ